MSGDLSVAFPVGVLACNLRIGRRGLHAAVGTDGARGDGVLARCRSGPVERPQAPCIFLLAGRIERRHLPGTAVKSLRLARLCWEPGESVSMSPERTLYFDFHSLPGLT